MSNTAEIKELAVAAWRLEKWLDNLNSDRKMAAKSALRSIKKYIAAMGVEVKDPIGSRFDPGLAIEVINNEDIDAAEEDLIIIETLTPYIYQNGELVQHARVIIGTSVKQAKPNNEIKAEPAPAAPEEGVCKAASPAEKEENDITISADDIERMKAYAKIL